MRQGIILLLGLVCSVSGWTQEAVFPYPELPASLTDDRARLGYMLEHFWERYDFSDTLHANQQVGEQGLVDFVTLMTYADSATCAKAANAFADSISSSEQRLGRFEDLLRQNRDWAVLRICSGIIWRTHSRLFAMIRYIVICSEPYRQLLSGSSSFISYP